MQGRIFRNQNIMRATRCCIRTSMVNCCGHFCLCNIAPTQRQGGLRASKRMKGLILLTLITLLSIVMVLYARDRLQYVLSQNSRNYLPFAQPGLLQRQYSAYNFTISPVIEIGLTANMSLHDPDPPDDEYKAEVEVDPSEEFPEEEQGLLEEDVSLLEQFAPLPDVTVHYVWCGHRFFDFRNYVAMKSVLDAVQPKKLLLHFMHMPMQDPDGYFTWFDRLNSLHSNIVLTKMNVTTKQCTSGGYKRVSLVFDILQRYGGMYIPEDAIFLRFADRFRRMNFVSGISSCNLNYFFEGIAIARYGQFKVPETENERVRMLSVCRDNDSLHPCIPEGRYQESTSGHVPSCVRLETALFPKNIWDANDKVSMLIKLFAYGKTDLKPRRSTLAMHKTPRIAHYLCTDDCKLSFSFYVSILSALHVGGLWKALIHGPMAPSGPWWDRLQKGPLYRAVHYVHREFSFQKDPKTHISNDMQRYIMRTEILLHYGGVFHDSHVIWTQPLPEQLLEYEAVASPDWHEHGNWPESVNHALLIARGGAVYLQQLLQIYHENANTKTPWFADHYLSYRLIELDPTLVFLYPQLQVKCLNHNCHPTWQPGYRSHYLINRPGNEFDWKTETLSIHWVDSFPELDLDQVRFTSGFIADVARNALSAAGVDVNHLG